MNKVFKLGFTLSVFAIGGCTNPGESITYTLINSSDSDREEVVQVNVEDSGLTLGNYSLKTSKAIYPAEVIDENKDGVVDVLLSKVQLKATETVKAEVVSAEGVPEKLTQAELSIKTGGSWNGRKYEGGEFQNVEFLSVPAEHTDHSYFIRYEGPGWESDKAGYRFYLDWRNGIDYFGKLSPEPVLQDVGQDGFDSYHEYSDWGMDLLKVGQTLGLGSIGRYTNDTLYRFKKVDSVTCRVKMNGLFRSAIETNYYNWQAGKEITTLNSVMSIEAGSALSTHQLTFSSPIQDFCTGLVVNEGEERIDRKVGDYRLLASYGGFSLNADQMGLAIIVKDNDIESVLDGAGSRIVKFKAGEEVTYHLMAVWEQGTFPVKSMTQFEEVLENELDKLNSPIEVVREK